MYILTVHTALNLGCWTQINGVRGREGAMYEVEDLHECQQSCIRETECVAIDWITISHGNICRNLTTTADDPLPPDEKKIAQYYRLDRDCISLQSTLHCAYSEFHFGEYKF